MALPKFSEAPAANPRNIEIVVLIADTIREFETNEHEHGLILEKKSLEQCKIKGIKLTKRKSICAPTHYLVMVICLPKVTLEQIPR